jgi:hypothetical protein
MHKARAINNVYDAQFENIDRQNEAQFSSKLIKQMKLTRHHAYLQGTNLTAGSSELTQRFNIPSNHRAQRAWVS